MASPRQNPQDPKIQSQIARLLEEQNVFSEAVASPASLRGYHYDFAMFRRFCESIERPYLPSSASTVGLYLTSLLSEGKKVSTATRRAAAIAWRHREERYESPVTSEVSDILRGARRMRCESVRRMRALTVPQLRAINTILTRDGSVRAIRNRCVMVTGFASALRSSNLVALQMADVELTEEGVILEVRREKNDPDCHGRLVGLPKGKHLVTCPLRSMQAWLKIRGTAPGPLFPSLFRLETLHPLMRGDAIARIVKACVRLIDLDRTQYASHSLRAGLISAAGKEGATALLISEQSGHADLNMLKRYLRRSSLFESNVAGMIGL